MCVSIFEQWLTDHLLSYISLQSTNRYRTHSIISSPHLQQFWKQINALKYQINKHLFEFLNIIFVQNEHKKLINDLFGPDHLGPYTVNTDHGAQTYNTVKLS